jgi:hypothetical protein
MGELDPEEGEGKMREECEYWHKTSSTKGEKSLQTHSIGLL